MADPQSEGPVVIEFDEKRPVRVDTASGVVEIKHGRAKNFFVRRDGKLHLLDCTCELCQEERKAGSAVA